MRVGNFSMISLVVSGLFVVNASFTDHDIPLWSTIALETEAPEPPLAAARALPQRSSSISTSSGNSRFHDSISSISDDDLEEFEADFEDCNTPEYHQFIARRDHTDLGKRIVMSAGRKSKRLHDKIVSVATSERTVQAVQTIHSNLRSAAVMLKPLAEAAAEKATSAVVSLADLWKEKEIPTRSDFEFSWGDSPKNKNTMNFFRDDDPRAATAIRPVEAAAIDPEEVEADLIEDMSPPYKQETSSPNDRKPYYPPLLGLQELQGLQGLQGLSIDSNPSSSVSLSAIPQRLKSPSTQNAIYSTVHSLRVEPENLEISSLNPEASFDEMMDPNWPEKLRERILALNLPKNRRRNPSPKTPVVTKQPV